MKKVIITLSVLVLALFGNLVLTNFFNNNGGGLSSISLATTYGYGPKHTHTFVYTKIDNSYHRVTCKDSTCKYNEVKLHVYDQLDGENSTTVSILDPSYTKAETKVIGNKKCRCGQSSPNNKTPQASAGSGSNETVELKNPCGHIRQGYPVPRYIDNGENTHIVECTSCGFRGEESHKYKNDVCYLCKHKKATTGTTTGDLHEGIAQIPGFTEAPVEETKLPEVLCKHEFKGLYNGWYKVDEKNHYRKCTKCPFEDNGEHYYNKDGITYRCGACDVPLTDGLYIKTPVALTHTHTYLKTHTNQYNGWDAVDKTTHYMVCADPNCSAKLPSPWNESYPLEHSDSNKDGRCDACHVTLHNGVYDEQSQIIDDLQDNPQEGSGTSVGDDTNYNNQISDIDEALINGVTFVDHNGNTVHMTPIQVREILNILTQEDGCTNNVNTIIAIFEGCLNHPAFNGDIQSSIAAGWCPYSEEVVPGGSKDVPTNREDYNYQYPEVVKKGFLAVVNQTQDAKEVARLIDGACIHATPGGSDHADAGGYGVAALSYGGYEATEGSILYDDVGYVNLFARSGTYPCVCTVKGRWGEVHGYIDKDGYCQNCDRRYCPNCPRSSWNDRNPLTESGYCPKCGNYY
ncbi:MAG: hypothetical protein IJS47_05775 [Clostridia bacterium]|nr:hypothetical protein [Clostridia bacterium]